MSETTPSPQHHHHRHPLHHQQSSIPPFTPPSPNQDQQKSSIVGATSNLLNVIIGAGIIGLPYAIKQSGIVAGTLLFLLVAFL
eukprot:CAMPEP_0172502652 /NCGR_PEP_ID=MMETSP1066-20121228/161688_1 /TAXON_ID=671091 /ORGANISM="Coscinodiscus wailesii, Strain CCMP2513" /LENGTH=82 /DNA_ID=CAMNT_0013277979 /DNA_START=11 /DNA_END=255 /DNA_ORIENTATION=-